jgi:uncharacterized protein (DUF736 family)
MSENNEKKSDWQEREIGALWQQTSKSGTKYYSGKVTVDGKTVNVVCYSVGEKKSENQPDVRIYIEKPKQ